MKKKLLAAVLTLILVLGSAMPVFAGPDGPPDDGPIRPRAECPAPVDVCCDDYDCSCEQ